MKGCYHKMLRMRDLSEKEIEQIRSRPGINNWSLQIIYQRRQFPQR